MFSPFVVEFSLFLWIIIVFSIVEKCRVCELFLILLKIAGLFYLTSHFSTPSLPIPISFTLSYLFFFFLSLSLPPAWSSEGEVTQSSIERCSQCVFTRWVQQLYTVSWLYCTTDILWIGSLQQLFSPSFLWLSFSLSLFVSLTHTHTHIPTHTQSLCLSLPHTHSHTHTHSHILYTHSLSLPHTHSLSHIHTHTHSLSLSHSVLREVQRQSYDHLSSEWQNLDPETLCAMINDNQVLRKISWRKQKPESKRRAN